MFEFMGVRVDPLQEAVDGELVRLGAARVPPPTVPADSPAYTFDGRLNDSFKAVNLLLNKGLAVQRVDKPGVGLHAGDFLTGSLSSAVLEEVARETGVSLSPLNGTLPPVVHPVKRLRVGIYQRYRGGNADEGWTRLLLEQFRFPFVTLLDAELKKGKLNEKFDVILVPDDSTATLVGSPDQVGPPEYRSGFGKEGTEALKAFVQKGGTLVTLAGACNFAIEKLALKVRSATSGKTAQEFWCPGSTLRAKFDSAHPLAYGMPGQGLVVFMQGNLAFDILPSEHNERYQIVATYADRDLLESGWLIGEETLARKPAMVSAEVGQGRVVLFGFRVQHRAQTHGTFKLLFNALVR
jgi:hypothetical protein